MGMLKVMGAALGIGIGIHAVNWTKNNIRYYREDIMTELRKQGLDQSERNTVMNILERHLPFASGPMTYQKTDPILESVEVIKEME